MRRAQLWATIGAVAATLLLTTAAPAAAESTGRPDRARSAAISTLSAAPALFGTDVPGTFSRGGVPVLPANALDGYPCIFGAFGCREPVLGPEDLQRGDTALTRTVARAPLTACRVSGGWLSVRFEDAKWGPMEGLVSADVVDLGSAEPGWC